MTLFDCIYIYLIIFTWHRYAQTKAQALEDADGDLERAIEILSTQITESAEDENLKLGERCQGIWLAVGLMSFKPCAPTTDVGCVGMNDQSHQQPMPSSCSW